MSTPFALRFVLTSLAAFALVALVQGRPPLANAGATATFDPGTLALLEGESGDLTVTVEKEVTQGEVDDGKIQVDLIEPEKFPFIDEVIRSKDAAIPAGTVAGDTVTVSVTFGFKCVDGVIEGSGEQFVTVAVEFGSTVFNADGFGFVLCLGVAVVTFDPNPLEIEEGAEDKVRVIITKYLSSDEANNKEITVRLMHRGTNTLLGTNKIELDAEAFTGQLVKKTTSFQLECRHNEIRGINGTGLPSAPLSVEFAPGGTDAGEGRALCVERTSSTFASGGARPADLFVLEETGSTVALNAFDGVLSVFDGDEQVDGAQLPCDGPGAFPCGYQNLGAQFLVDGSLEILAVDKENDSTIIVRDILITEDTRVAGAPQFTEIPVGDAPTGLALDPVTGHYYVTNSGDGTVSVIDPEAALVIDTINVGGVPRNAAADPEVGIVYVTDFTGDALIVIDTETNTVVDTIAVGDGAEGVTVDPETGGIYVTNFIDDSLSVISGAAGVAAAPAGGVQVQTVAVGDGPIDVDVNPMTNRIFVVNANDDTMSVINRTTLEVTATLPTGITPDAVAVNQGKGLVYVANHDVNSLTIYSDPSHFAHRLWGDMDCDGSVGAGDVLLILSWAGDVPGDGVLGCPGIGQPVDILSFLEQAWGDVNCDGVIDAFDALLLILAFAGASVPDGGPGCPDVNEQVYVY